MACDNLTTTTLFGEEVYLVPRKRGRPPFEWTEKNSNKVSMLLAMGWSNERIANVVIDPRTGKSISIPTLKRYFRAELARRDVERDRLKAHQLLQAFKAAEAGNVGAMRFFNQLVERNDMMAAEAIVGRKQAEDAPEEKLGKKQQVALDADAADRKLGEQLAKEAAQGNGRTRH